MFQIYRPNTGLQVKHESLEELEKKYKKVLSDEAEPHWTKQFDASVNTCSHSYWKGMCRYVTMGQDCEVIFYTNVQFQNYTQQHVFVIFRSVFGGEPTLCCPVLFYPFGLELKTI